MTSSAKSARPKTAGKRAPRLKKAAAAEAPSPPELYSLLIRYRPAATAAAPQSLETIELKIDDHSFYLDVERWRYVVANRRRITGETRNMLAGDVQEWLAERALLSDVDASRHVRAMASAGLVEVVVPFEKESQAWAARLFPWEATLALATRPWRNEREPFTVVRYLKSKDKKHLPPPTPLSLLVVRSAPGEIGANNLAYERECEMVASTLQPQLPQAAERLNEPDRTQLQETILRMAPTIVHLVGNQEPRALQRLNLQSDEPQDTDGFVLRKAERGYDTVAPDQMARLLTAGLPAPLLLAASTCFSASRLCAISVGLGAHYAIGFFDTLTDADALLFFGQFYREWSQGWEILRAFDSARAAWLAQHAGAQIGGVVLWSRHSLLDPDPSVTTAQATPSTTSELEASVDDLTLVPELNLDVGSSGMLAKRTSLNYSLLHNDRSPFRTFYLDKPRKGKLPPLHVEVLLEVGNDSCRCRFAQELPEAKCGIELASRIRLPLVAGLLRQCTESLRTNLYVHVRCGERLLLESSERVTVLPPDEWRDDGEDHRWLPSFVLPRDPAVLKVIGSAQRYLRTLLDDCTAGFDGYQQLAPDDSNAAAVVDPQVQAIWAALQHDLPLNYINPPPSYTSRSQRLRSPSEVLRGQAATCIDLALLFASCLEFVGIYPVLFLIEGHAFPGYWRSDKAWWRMKQFHFDPASTTIAEPAVPALPTPTSVSSGQSESWMFDGVGNLVEMLRYVQDGSLVPFESTFVAKQRGFYASLEEGSARLHPDTFDAMVDIQSARGANVTPLPLFDKFE